MKVLQINSVCGYGSTGRISTDLYDILEKEGHECCIAFGRGAAPEGYQTIKIGNNCSVYSHVLKTRLTDLHGLGSTKATKLLIKQIMDYNPELIQLHNIHGYYLNYKILFDYLATIDIPIVWLMHDEWAILGHSAYSDDSVNSNNIYKEYPKSLFVNNSRRNLQLKEKEFTQVKNMTIITPSEWLNKIIANSFLNKYEIITIHNGINLDLFTPKLGSFRNNYGLIGKKIILGVASDWGERKGLSFFNKLAEDLNSEFKIVLVGINAKLEKEVNKNILCIERTNNIDELAELYSTSDLFLNPTLLDNFPTTNIEALACGTPVITFNTGGSPEAINSETGIVIERGDYQALLTEVNNFRFNSSYEAACRNRARLFNKDKIYNQYIELYKSLI